LFSSSFPSPSVGFILIIAKHWSRWTSPHTRNSRSAGTWSAMTNRTASLPTNFRYSASDPSRSAVFTFPSVTSTSPAVSALIVVMITFFITESLKVEIQSTASIMLVDTVIWFTGTVIIFTTSQVFSKECWTNSVF